MAHSWTAGLRKALNVTDKDFDDMDAHGNYLFVFSYFRCGTALLVVLYAVYYRNLLDRIYGLSAVL